MSASVSRAVRAPYAAAQIGAVAPRHRQPVFALGFQPRAVRERHSVVVGLAQRAQISGPAQIAVRLIEQHLQRPVVQHPALVVLLQHRLQRPQPFLFRHFKPPPALQVGFQQPVSQFPIHLHFLNAFKRVKRGVSAIFGCRTGNSPPRARNRLFGRLRAHVGAQRRHLVVRHPQVVVTAIVDVPGIGLLPGQRVEDADRVRAAHGDGRALCHDDPVDLLGRGGRHHVLRLHLLLRRKAGVGRAVLEYVGRLHARRGRAQQRNFVDGLHPHLHAAALEVGDVQLAAQRVGGVKQRRHLQADVHHQRDVLADHVLHAGDVLLQRVQHVALRGRESGMQAVGRRGLRIQRGQAVAVDLRRDVHALEIAHDLAGQAVDVRFAAVHRVQIEALRAILRHGHRLVGQRDRARGVAVRAAVAAQTVHRDLRDLHFAAAVVDHQAGVGLHPAGDRLGDHLLVQFALINLGFFNAVGHVGSFPGLSAHAPAERRGRIVVGVRRAAGMLSAGARAARGHKFGYGRHQPLRGLGVALRRVLGHGVDIRRIHQLRGDLRPPFGHAHALKRRSNHRLSQPGRRRGGALLRVPDAGLGVRFGGFAILSRRFCRASARLISRVPRRCIRRTSSRSRFAFRLFRSSSCRRSHSRFARRILRVRFGRP
nr:MAG TPA: hypothetical protein [Caudoviricetes sp.]